VLAKADAMTPETPQPAQLRASVNASTGLAGLILTENIMFNIANIIHAVRNDSSASSLIAEAGEPNEVQASVPPLERKRPSRRRPPSRALKPTVDPNPSSIEEKSAKLSEAATTARVERISSKCDCVLKLLRRENGATLTELMIATNWQAHSVRGFLSGTVRKKLRLNLISEINGDGVRRYSVEAVGKAEVFNDIKQVEPIDLPAFCPFRMTKGIEALASNQAI